VLAQLSAKPGPDAGLAEYLEPHMEHTRYRQRLVEGRSIGSGMLEATCKTAIGRRLK